MVIQGRGNLVYQGSCGHTYERRNSMGRNTAYYEARLCKECYTATYSVTSTNIVSPRNCLEQFGTLPRIIGRSGQLRLPNGRIRKLHAKYQAEGAEQIRRMQLRRISEALIDWDAIGSTNAIFTMQRRVELLCKIQDAQFWFDTRDESPAVMLGYRKHMGFHVHYEGEQVSLGWLAGRSGEWLYRKVN